MKLASSATSTFMIAAILMLTVASQGIEPPIAAVPEIDLIRLDGHLGAPKPGEKYMAVLTVNCHGTDVPFVLDGLTALTSNRSPVQILQDIKPYKPNLYLHSDAELMQRLQTSGINDHLEITGNYRFGSQELLLDSVDTRPAGSAGSPARR